MHISPERLPELLQAVSACINEHEQELTQLDKAIGDGDHVTNLRRGLDALLEQQEPLKVLDWSAAWQKMGLICMSKIGGASGSLFGTLFVSMAKAAKDQVVDPVVFAQAFAAGVDSMRLRGKAEAGEKTLLDVLIPVAQVLTTHSGTLALPDLLQQVERAALDGVEATRDMLATKGRASFLGERSLGHLDPGAQSCQLMLSAIAATLRTFQ